MATSMASGAKQIWFRAPPFSSLAVWLHVNLPPSLSLVFHLQVGQEQQSGGCVNRSDKLGARNLFLALSSRPLSMLHQDLGPAEPMYALQVRRPGARHR